MPKLSTAQVVALVTIVSGAIIAVVQVLAGTPL